MGYHTIGRVSRLKAHQEAAGLVGCFTTHSGGMFDLVTGTWGTRNGAADPFRISDSGHAGYLVNHFVAGDEYVFGTAELINTAQPFTICWESYLASNYTWYPAVTGILSNFNVCAICYNNQASERYISFLPETTAQWRAFRMDTLPAGVTLTDQWHYGVITYNGNGATTLSNFNMHLNGHKITLNTSTGLGAVTNRNTVGRTDDGFTNWSGQIRQVRVYNREWTDLEALRFCHSATHDLLFAPSRRKSYLGRAAAAAAYQSRMWHTFY